MMRTNKVGIYSMILFVVAMIACMNHANADVQADMLGIFTAGGNEPTDALSSDPTSSFVGGMGIPIAGYAESPTVKLNAGFIAAATTPSVGLAERILLTADPQSAVVPTGGSTASVTLTAELRDANNNWVSDNNTAQIMFATDFGQLQGTTTLTAKDGRATIVLQSAISGVAHVRATSNGLDDGLVTVTFTGAATKLVCTALPAVIVADGRSTATVRCEVQDDAGLLVTGYTEAVNFTAAGMTFNPTIPVNGVATIQVQSTLNPGTATVTCTSGALQGQATVKWDKLAISIPTTLLGSPGKEVLVPINLGGPAPMAGAQVTVTFDENSLIFLGVQKGAIVAGDADWKLESNLLSSGKLTMLLNSGTTVKTFSLPQSKPLMLIRFRVGDAAILNTSLALKFVDATKVVDEHGEALPLGRTDGTLTISTASVLPAPPSDLKAIASPTQISLSWSPVTTNTDGSATETLAGYNVYRGTTTDQTTTKVNNNLITGTTFADSSVQPGTYYYAVTAVLSATPLVESQKSSEATAVIPGTAGAVVRFEPATVTRNAGDKSKFQLAIVVDSAPNLGKVEFTLPIPAGLIFDPATNTAGNLVDVVFNTQALNLPFSVFNQGAIQVAAEVKSSTTQPLKVCTISLTHDGTTGTREVKFSAVTLRDANLAVIATGTETSKVVVTGFLLSDFNTDGVIDIADASRFIDAWIKGHKNPPEYDVLCDMAPLKSAATIPYLSTDPQPDSVINIKDASVFLDMWVWSHQPSKARTQVVAKADAATVQFEALSPMRARNAKEYTLKLVADKVSDLAKCEFAVTVPKGLAFGGSTDSKGLLVDVIPGSAAGSLFFTEYDAKTRTIRVTTSVLQDASLPFEIARIRLTRGESTPGFRAARVCASEVKLCDSKVAPVKARVESVMIDLGSRRAALVVSGLRMMSGRGVGSAIVFVSTVDGYAEIKVLNAAGKIVRVFQCKASAGLNTFSWDGKDQRGRSLPVGTYLCQVVVSNSDGATAQAITAAMVR